MARLFLPIYAVVMSLCSIEMADVDSSNHDVHKLSHLLPVKDIVIDTVHEYLQEQEKRLGTLRKHIEDYLKECEQGKQKVGKTLSATIQESSINDNEEVKEEADESDVNNLHDYAVYAGTNYGRLCSGEILLTEDIQKTLKCRYVDHGVPFLKIAPFKEEEACLKPRIVLYHDVIYEEEIEFLKKYSKPWLKNAKTSNIISGKEMSSEDRIAKSATVEEENKHVKLLYRRVEHMTGLSVDTFELLEVTYYEVGGLYLPHLDYFGKDGQFFNSNVGDRIATVLFYMNDVAKGGATVFPDLNIALWPKKGSAVFWHNLKRNGEGDPLTAHGACPVLSGTKWKDDHHHGSLISMGESTLKSVSYVFLELQLVVTKWLHEEGQEFHRPCSLLENE